MTIFSGLSVLTHWGQKTHIRVSELTIIGSDTGLSPGRRQVIIWPSAGALLIWNFGTTSMKCYSKLIYFHSRKCISAKWRPFCSRPNALMPRHLQTGPRFNIKMSSYRYRKSHCGDKTVVRSSYLHNGISYTGKMTSLYWFSPLKSTCSVNIP